MTIIACMTNRKSCRTYSDRAVEPEKRAALSSSLATRAQGPFSSELRFDLLDFGGMDTRALKALTTYGVIKGARHFIVGAVQKGPKAMEDFGYCMEKQILQATALGLGTCWLGGTFKRSGFAAAMGLQKGELLPAISPVGYPRETRSIVDSLFRYVAASDRRKPWSALFYLLDTDHGLDDGQAGAYKTPLECVRLAPSASNKQPWRIVKGRDAFHFYLERTKGYGNVGRDIALQNIDMGIAMCHFELSARELGLQGSWLIADPENKPAGMEYTASWALRG